MNVHHFYIRILFTNILSFDTKFKYNSFSITKDFPFLVIIVVIMYIFDRIVSNILLSVFYVKIRMSFLSQTFYWFWYDITNEKLEHPIMMIINCLKAHDGADCSIIKVKSSLRYPYRRKLIRTSKRMLEQN